MRSEGKGKRYDIKRVRREYGVRGTGYKEDKKDLEHGKRRHAIKENRTIK